VRKVERLTKDGNQAFKVGKLQEALTLYTDALEVRSSPPYSTLSPFT
jgi:hypothetical protein